MSKRHRQERNAEQPPTARWIEPNRDIPRMLDQLHLIPGARAEIDELQDQWVRTLLACGVPYSDIAAALGVSRQVIHRRYGKTTLRALTVQPDGSLAWVVGPNTRRTPEGAVNDR